MNCSICGCDKYTKAGNTTGGRWLFKCSNGHTWRAGTTKKDFPWRDDDYYHPKNYAWDVFGRYQRKDNPMCTFYI